jgi:PTS system mannose-specific IIC component
MWHDVVLVGLIGGFVSLDRSVAFQFMVSRPLVTGPIIGLVLGDVYTGVMVGALLELLWISRLPLGGIIPPNECLGCILITASAILARNALHLSPPESRTMVVMALLLGLPLAQLASFLETKLRYWNIGLSRKALAEVDAGHSGGLFRLNLAGLAAALAGNTAFIMICLPLLILLLKIVHPWLPHYFTTTFEMLFPFLPIVGIASALSNINLGKSVLVFSSFYFLSLGLLCL